MIQHKHLHAGEKLYKCDVCNKSFTQHSNMIQHKHLHTGEKPYKCDVCNKSFAWHSNLTRHKRLHSGEKSYKCDVCNKSFTQHSSLILHKCVHTAHVSSDGGEAVQVHYAVEGIRGQTSSQHSRLPKHMHTGEKSLKRLLPTSGSGRTSLQQHLYDGELCKRRESIS